MPTVHLHYALSYIANTAEFMRARKTAILLSAFLMAPLLAIPGALLFPFFALADASVGWVVRFSMLIVIALAWHAWLTSQKPLLRSICDIPVLASGCSRQRLMQLSLFRYLIFCWPLGFLLPALFVVADSGRRGIVTSLWTLGVITFTSLAKQIPLNRLPHSLSGSRSSLMVLAARACGDVTPFSDATRFARYLGMLTPVVCAAWLCRDIDQIPFARYHFAIGLAVACLPLRGLLAAAADEDKAFGALYVCSPAYKVLVGLRSGWVVLFFNGMVYTVFAHFSRLNQGAPFDWATLAAVASFTSVCILLGQLVRARPRWDGALLFLPLVLFIIGDVVP